MSYQIKISKYHNWKTKQKNEYARLLLSRKEKKTHINWLLVNENILYLNEKRRRNVCMATPQKNGRTNAEDFLIKQE